MARRFVLGTMERMRDLGLDTQQALDRALAILDLRITRQATVLSFNHVFRLVTILFAISIPLVLLLKTRRLEKGKAVMVE